MRIRILLLNLFLFSIMLNVSQCQQSEFKTTRYTNPVLPIQVFAVWGNIIT